MKPTLFLTLLGAFFFIPFLGGVHLFDWDEINFAEISREMMLTGDYLRSYINFEPFYQKPPFFFWTQVLAMKAFGVNEFAARLPNAVCGIITLVLLYRIGRRLFDDRFGLIWAGGYFGSVLPFLYFKSGIIDPFFNLFIFLGLYFFILFYWKKEGFDRISLSRSHWYYLFLGGLFTGMAILTKGPVGYLIVALTLGVYWIYQRLRLYVSIPQFIFFTLAALLVTFAWLGTETLRNGPEFIRNFTAYQYELFSTPDAGHGGFPGYHFVVLLVGCFPASVFALRAFFALPSEKGEKDYQINFRLWMKILFWVVLILFTVVRSKIVHYSSMCYFPLTFLAATVIDRILRGGLPLAAWMKALLLSVGGLFVLATIALPFVAMNAEVLKPLFRDPFARANLDAQVSWTGLEIIPGVFLLALLLFFLIRMRKGRGEQAFAGLFGGTAVFVMLTLVFFVKRIEGYSQRAAVEFFESKADDDVYIMTHAYKSYAHLFYARKQPVTNPESFDTEWLLNGDIDKDVYVVCKIHKADELRGRPQLEEIGTKNGFVFFLRPAAK